MATHSSILAWRIPWTEELGGLQSTGSQRIGLAKNPVLQQRVHDSESQTVRSTSPASKKHISGSCQLMEGPPPRCSAGTVPCGWRPVFQEAVHAQEKQAVHGARTEGRALLASSSVAPY